MKRGEERAYNLERLKKEQEMRRVFEFVNFLTRGGYFCDDTLPENVILEHIKKNLSPEMLEYLGASEYPATLDEFLNICATKLIASVATRTKIISSGFNAPINRCILIRLASYTRVAFSLR